MIEYNPNAIEHSSNTITLPGYQSGGQIKKRTVRTVKSYDEEGRIVSEETVEEVEYTPTQVYPQWGQAPLISNGINREAHLA